MHDIDTTRPGLGSQETWETEGQETYEADQEWESEQGFESDQEWESVPEGESGDFEEEGLDEGEIDELALELFNVSSEQELDQFLGKFIGKMAKKFRGIGGFLKKAGKPFLGALKGIAKKALPFVGGALGSFIPIPGVGTAVGSALGSAASKLLESELGEFNEEEREYEMARRYVRFSRNALVAGSRMGRIRDPRAAVIASLRAALRRMRHQLILAKRRRRVVYVRRPCPRPAAGAPVAAAPAYVTGPAPIYVQPPPAAAVPVEPTAGGVEPGGDFGGEPAAAGGSASADTGDSGASAEPGGTDGAGGEGVDPAAEWEIEPEPSAGQRGGGGRQGRWIRRGRKIVLYGV